MDNSLDSYWVIIFISVTIIISFLFNLISKKTNIPSVLLLIGTGIALNEIGLTYLYEVRPNFMPALEILGIIGLIMIVLEAALDLKLTLNKWPLILKSFITAAFLLLVSAGVIAWLISKYIKIDFNLALLYAIPLSVMSSAIVIPSIFQLDVKKREFMIYEATFSDILGIIFFYAQINIIKTNDVAKSIANTFGEIGITVVLSLLFTIAIVFLFQKILKETNYFLIFAILLLLYSIGKLFHLSSLIIILVFGLIINNKNLFFRGFLRRAIDPLTYEGILRNFKLFTQQTSFVVRTFFFVFFGMTISLSVFTNIEIYTITGLIILALFLIRLLNLTILFKTRIFPEIFVAPRGLITILLFFSIPREYLVETFENDIVFLVIIITNVIMMFALMIKPGEEDAVNKLPEKE